MKLAVKELAQKVGRSRGQGSEPLSNQYWVAMSVWFNQMYPAVAANPRRLPWTSAMLPRLLVQQAHDFTMLRPAMP